MQDDRQETATGCGCGDENPCCAAAPQPQEGSTTPVGFRTFTVDGLCCGEEVTALKRAVGPLVGGEDRLSFDILNGRMMVSDNGDAVSSAAIRDAVARTGMTAEERQSGARGAADNTVRHTQMVATGLSGLGVLAGILLQITLGKTFTTVAPLVEGHSESPAPWPAVVFYALAIVLGLRFVLPKAWFAARHASPDINLLMVVAITGAVVIGEWFEAATVAFLFALSLALESWSVGRARRAISSLLDLAPPTVRMVDTDGRERDIAADMAQVGTRFVVRPGERIPLDGNVLSGASNINQAPITGESIPVAKTVGADVFAGTVNGDGALVVESTKAADDTTLARIIRMVEEAHTRRAHVEQWVERFARIYTPGVMLLALAVFLVPPLVYGGLWADWLYRALVLLVVACPCALVISTPVSIVAGLAAAARNGVLVKGGIFLELPARLSAFAFDKTGTVTRGTPSLRDVIALNGHVAAEVLEKAAMLEARSTHPLADAVRAHAASQGITFTSAEDMRTVKGRGVTGTISGTSFWLGSHRYLVERGVEDPATGEKAVALEKEGNTVVALGTGDQVIGLLAIADTLRPEAAQSINALRACGIEHIVMLTGDNRTTAEAVGRAIGVNEVQAELLPEEKLAAIEAIGGRYGGVAMVGDGVNDAPAMARADLGIAMGAAGSDAAIETADIALMTDDLTRLPWLLRHSRRTLGIIRQNIFFALGLKAAFVVLVFAGMATLWAAIAADVGASLLVVSNALRLLNDAATNRAGRLSDQAGGHS